MQMNLQFWMFIEQWQHSFRTKLIIMSIFRAFQIYNLLLNIRYFLISKYVILRKLANFIDFRFLHVCVQNTWDFVFKIYKIVKKIKTNVGRLLSISKMTKGSILAKCMEHFFFIIKTKSSLFTSVFIFSTISQILCILHKHVETGSNCSQWTCYFSGVSHALNGEKNNHL